MPIVILLSILEFCVILFAIIAKKIITKKEHTLQSDAPRTQNKATTILLALCCICVLLSVSINLARAKGMEPNATISEFIEGFSTTPYEDKLPDDFTELAGSLIVYYRYDCPLCHSTMDEIKSTLKDYPVYYVCTRSEQGKALRELYPIDVVPSIVYICNNPVTVHYSSPIAIQDGDSGVMLNQDGLDRILEFYEKQY